MTNSVRNLQKIGLDRGFVNVSDEYRSVHFAPLGYRRSRTVIHVDFHTGNPLRSAPTLSGNSAYVRNIGHRGARAVPPPEGAHPPCPEPRAFRARALPQPHRLDTGLRRPRGRTLGGAVDDVTRIGLELNRNSAEASFPRPAAPTSSPGADTAVTGSASTPTTRVAHHRAHQGPHVRQRAQRHGRRRLPCVERGWRRRHPVARHRRVEPAVGLPVHRDGGGYHTIACVRSGKVLDKAVLGGGGRGGRTDDRRRPDEPAVAAAPAGRGGVRPGRPQQGVNDQAIALSSSKGARCLPSSADGACCK